MVRNEDDIFFLELMCPTSHKLRNLVFTLSFFAITWRVAANVEVAQQNHSQMGEVIEISSDSDSDDDQTSTITTTTAAGTRVITTYIANEDLFTHPSLSNEQRYRTFLHSLRFEQPRNNEILQMIDAHNALDHVLKIGNDCIQKKDIEVISDTKSVTDQVISFFFKQFLSPRETQVAQRLRRKKWYLFNSHFIHNNQTQPDHTARRWKRHIDFNDRRGILIPWNIDNVHWALIVVDFETATMSLFDSLWSGDKRAPKRVMAEIEKYIARRCKIHPNLTPHNITKWKQSFNRGKIPEQPNSVDCGIYTCFFADYVTLGFKFYGHDRTIGATYRRYIMYQLGRYLTQGNHHKK
jgi:Ulp1 family protease